MDKAELVNLEAVLIYYGGSKEAIRSAQFNLDNGFYGVAINRSYYAYFYGATALLLTQDLTRSKHSGVLAAFREYFVKTGLFAVSHSYTYGEAFELRNVTDYETLGQADLSQAQTAVDNADQFITACKAYLTTKGYL